MNQHKSQLSLEMFLATGVSNPLLKFHNLLSNSSYQTIEVLKPTH